MRDGRATWDEVWLEVSKLMGQRSRCSRRGVGAVLVSKDERVVSTGYNGPPSGMYEGETCVEFCPRADQQTSQELVDYVNCVSIHAESNALLRADFTQLEDGTLYCSSAVCFDCAKLVANVGLARVVMIVDWIEDAHRAPARSIQFLRDSGLDVKVVEV